ncbi:MAG TPA: flavodoxin family protein [Victivallales bacterium]|nr:flavodoxin family protein [Victivallales bacterium]
MKVLAINSSSRCNKTSKTYLMLTHLVKGMSNAGANVEIINLRDKKIKNCIGCFNCWVKTNGTCTLNDDMTNELFFKWKSSDIVVYSTPLFYHHMNAVMSTFQERLLPNSLPFFQRNESKTTHPSRQQSPKAVWLSVCGFPEISEFEVFSSYIKRTYHKNLIAEIYRSAAETMIENKYKHRLNEILLATEKAGKEIVEHQKISKNTLSILTAPIDDTDFIHESVNSGWEKEIENNC